ncbi:MAG: hypothetical protein LBF12_00440 [Christensenellaceae bacterium]|jgi:hypothetical protein|nr:hypothetical protein [Christensenellaceae bacterium]
MPKSMPKIIAIVLLTTIIALSIIASNKDGYFKNSMHNAISGDSEPIEKQQVNVPHTDLINNATSALYDNFPKSATTSTEFEFEQTIKIEGNITYNKTHTIHNSTLLITTCYSTGGDFNSEYQTVVVMKLLEDGTISKLTRLSVNSDSSYLSSQVSLTGLLVAVSKDSGSMLFELDSDLEIVSTTSLLQATGITIYSNPECCLLILNRGKNETFFYNNGILTSGLILPDGIIVDIIETNDCFVIFLNNDSFYEIIFLNKQLNAYTSSIILNKKLIAVMPTIKNKEFCYICIETTSNSALMTIYTSLYEMVNQECYFLDIYTKIEAFIGTKTLLVNLENLNGRKLNYLINGDGLISPLDDTTITTESEILDCVILDNIYLLIIKEYNETSCTTFYDNNLIPKLKKNIQGSFNFSLVFINKKFALIINQAASNDELSIYKLSI